MADVDDHRLGPRILRIGVARKEPRHFFNRLLRRGKPDAHRRAMRQRVQPLQRKRKMHAAFVIGHGVNFIHNHGLDIAQNGAALLRCQQDVERLGRRNQNVRRAFQHQAAVFHQRVAGAHGRPYLGHQQAAIASHLQNLSQWDFKIFLDVVAERFERGHVENFCAVVQFARKSLADEPVNAGQESGESLARSGGSRNQRGVSCQDVGPALFLRLGWRRKSRGEPLLHQRMSPGERRRDNGRHGGDCSEKL